MLLQQQLRDSERKDSDVCFTAFSAEVLTQSLFND